MYYKELLRGRNALMWYVISLVLVSLFIYIVNAVTPSGHVHVTAGDPPHVHKTAAVPWMIGYALAGWFAAILSTVLGSTLSQENDHLALAWTKPASRTAYATAMMAVDAACIVIAQLATFGFIAALFIALSHSIIKVVGSPDDLINVARFTFFPLAWYAIIIALSARLRNKGGIVQGLIWPVAIGLAVAGASGLPTPWHQIFGTLNILNPILYTGYHAGNVSTGVVVDSQSGPFMVDNVVSTIALAAFVVVGWLAATVQWRRLEA